MEWCIGADLAHDLEKIKTTEHNGTDSRAHKDHGQPHNPEPRQRLSQVLVNVIHLPLYFGVIPFYSFHLCLLVFIHSSNYLNSQRKSLSA